MNRRLLLLVVVFVGLLAGACATAPTAEPPAAERRTDAEADGGDEPGDQEDAGDGGGQKDAGGHGGYEHAGAGGEPTTAQRAAADQLVTDTTAGIARFADLAAAKAEGYQAVTPTWLPVVHYVHPDYLRNGDVLDPDRPESLVYGHSGQDPVLLGAMFLMAEPGVPGPQIGGPLTVWHTHDDLCIDVARQMVVGFVDADGGCPEGAVNEETPEMLHVWVVDHPDGPFGHDMSPAAVLRTLPS